MWPIPLIHFKYSGLSRCEWGGPRDHFTQGLAEMVETHLAISDVDEGLQKDSGVEPRQGARAPRAPQMCWACGSLTGVCRPSGTPGSTPYSASRVMPCLSVQCVSHRPADSGSAPRFGPPQSPQHGRRYKTAKREKRLQELKDQINCDYIILAMLETLNEMQYCLDATDNGRFGCVNSELQI